MARLEEREGFSLQDKSVGLSGHYGQTGSKDKGSTDRIRLSGCQVIMARQEVKIRTKKKGQDCGSLWQDRKQR